MARLRGTSVQLGAGGAILLALSLSACSRPQSPEPMSAAPAPEAPAELLGGTTLAVAEPAVAAPMAPSAPARRPGWGTMAPIANPGEVAVASYRVIGPSAPTAYAERRGPVLRTDNRARASSRSFVITDARPIVAVERAPAAKRRVKHWIIPTSGGAS